MEKTGYLHVEKWNWGLIYYPEQENQLQKDKTTQCELSNSQISKIKNKNIL